MKTIGLIMVPILISVRVLGSEDVAIGESVEKIYRSHLSSSLTQVSRDLISLDSSYLGHRSRILVGVDAGKVRSLNVYYAEGVVGVNDRVKLFTDVRGKLPDGSGDIGCYIRLDGHDIYGNKSLMPDGNINAIIVCSQAGGVFYRLSLTGSDILQMKQNGTVLLSVYRVDDVDIPKKNANR